MNNDKGTNKKANRGAKVRKRSKKRQATKKHAKKSNKEQARNSKLPESKITPDKKGKKNNNLGAQLHGARANKSDKTLKKEFEQLLNSELNKKHDTSKRPVKRKRIKPTANDRTLRSRDNSIKQQDSEAKVRKRSKKRQATKKHAKKSNKEQARNSKLPESKITPDKKGKKNNNLGAQLHGARANKSDKTLKKEFEQLLNSELNKKHDTSKRPVKRKRIKPTANDRTLRSRDNSIKQQDSEAKGAKKPGKIRSTGKGKSKEVVTVKRIDGGNAEEEKRTTKKILTQKEKKQIKQLQAQRSYINKKLKPLKEYVFELGKVKNRKTKVSYKNGTKTVAFIIKDKLKEIVALNKELQAKGKELESLGATVKWDKVYRDLKSEPQKKGVLRLPMCMHFQMDKVYDYLKQEHTYNGFTHKFNSFVTEEGIFYDIEEDADQIIQWCLITEAKMTSKHVFYLKFDLEDNTAHGYVDKEPDITKVDTKLYDKSYAPKKKEVKPKEPQPRKIKPIEDFE